ncbi:MAG: amino acid adenylation domain-containing protein, partial [Staphylococcus equorum]|nr:amino acid adenylation domain-containing protein [Staphylococcus equorum]
MIAILGVLKAGGAYVPIAPTFPDTRIHYILEDTQSALVLTQRHLVSRFRGVIPICLDDNLYQSQESINLTIGSRSTDLAYVIYTSGTTGNPKGVMIEHRSYVEIIQSLKEKYFSTHQSISTYSITNYVFDIFGVEYGLPLLTGGFITLGDSNFNFLDCSRYDFFQMTPSLCEVKIDCLMNTDSIVLLIGGENIKRDLLSKLLRKSISVINVYGPTETTIWSASKFYNNQDTDLTHISFGKPFLNENMYVLNNAQQLLPVGVIGELYIGGVGLARGYLNQVKLTSDKFVKNPFQTENEVRNSQNYRLYKTGDLVKWLPDGNLEYIGRNDFQVKIRGYRIELEEIESAILPYPHLEKVVVLAKECVHDGNEHHKYLVAYYISHQDISEEALIEYSKQHLQDYMIPAVFIRLETFPYTVNGKLDRKALPDPEFKINKQYYVAPGTDIEKQICTIWQSVLSLDTVGVMDDFFRLGGNSILAIQLTSRMNKGLNTNLTVADVFRYKCIRSILESINAVHNRSIIKWLSSYSKPLPTMYFFHPGAGGCEVYQQLANLLEDSYQSVGIDNYNMFYDDKISCLSDLANVYIHEIERTFPFVNEINLCGWSLGGQIALEIAYCLEQKGFKKINVYL